MNKFSGIDLHSNNSVVVVSDEADRIVTNGDYRTIWYRSRRHWRRIARTWWGWSSKRNKFDVVFLPPVFEGDGLP
jgi:hypothetical protein